MNKSGNVTSEPGGVKIPFPHERSVVDFFRQKARAQPDGLAVQVAGAAMTYGELDLSSSRLADELQQRGLHLEDPVGILLPASGEYVVAMLGILKAGGSYLPIDPEVPARRLEFLLQDSGSRFVLTNAAGMKRMGDWPGPALDLAEIIHQPGRENCQNSVVTSDPRRRAYIIYTSGSTGEPKGVEIEHHSLTNLVWHYHQRLNLTAQDRTAMLSHVAFDASVADIWPILCAGGIVAIPPKGILLNPDGLIAWLAAEQITLTFVPTGVAEILFVRPWPERMKLRFLITGGDRLRVRPPAGLPFAILNGYGPTENTVFSTWSVVSPGAGTGQPPPIGRPIGNVTTHVLDAHRQPVPAGVAGELYLGGEQVARSYLGRPELTQEYFSADPFAGRPDARMYRTGDWVRWLADGELDFLGRKDGQIQIRGRRVELGEIETTLFAHGAVRQVCCVPWLDDGMPSGVIAHIVPGTRAAGLSEELRGYLQARLPDYMVPAEFVVHERLPLTPQGKLDRAALIALQSAGLAAPQLAEGADGLESGLARLWHSLLPAADHSPRDATFASLGGDSLLMVKLMLGVEAIINQRLEASTFLLQPTFSGLCQAVRNRMSRTEFQPVLTIRKQGTRPPLFCLHQHSGDIDVYFGLAEALGDDQPVFGIRSPALEDLSRLPLSIEAAAAEIVGHIRKLQPQGGPALVGYSWAGLLAFEVARQFAKQEEVVCFTALIGADAPMRPTNLATRLLHFAKSFLPWLWHLIMDRENRRRRLSSWREMVRRTGKNLADVRQPMPGWASSPVSRHMIGLVGKYCPPPKSNVAVDLFRERDSYQPQPHPLHAWQTSNLPDSGWERWTLRQPRVHWVEGDHDDIIKPPAVSGLAQSIRHAMDQHLKCHLPVLELATKPR